MKYQLDGYPKSNSQSLNQIFTRMEKIQPLQQNHEENIEMIPADLKPKLVSRAQDLELTTAEGGKVLVS